MLQVRSALSHLVRWYRSPTGLILATLLMAAATSLALGYHSFAIAILLATSAVIIPYKLDRLDRDVRKRKPRVEATKLRQQSLRRSLHSLRTPEPTADLALLDVDHLASEVAALHQQLQYVQERSLSLQREFGLMKANLSDPE